MPYITTSKTTALRPGDRILNPHGWEEVVSMDEDSAVRRIDTIVHWTDDYIEQGYRQDEPSFFFSGVNAVHTVLAP